MLVARMLGLEGGLFAVAAIGPAATVGFTAIILASREGWAYHSPRTTPRYPRLQRQFGCLW